MAESDTIQTLQETTPESLLEENYQKFIQLLGDSGLTLGDIPTEYVKHSDYAEAKITFQKQEFMENVITIVEKSMGMNILYAINSDRHRYYEAMAYSTTSLLTVITFQSYEYGILKGMTATFFTDYAPMYEMVSRKILSVMTRKGQGKITVKENRNLKKVYKDFFEKESKK